MTDFKRPIAYLENDDFDSDGKLIAQDIPANKPVFIMIQSTMCGHCVSAKPAFQEFADKHAADIFCATIHVDGKRASERDLKSKLQKINPKILGYPDFSVFKNGKLVANYSGKRDAQSFFEFVQKYI